jgi:hypothetical protein
MLLLMSAKGADARHQTREGLASPSGGALDTATVLREFHKSSVRLIYGSSIAGWTYRGAERYAKTRRDELRVLNIESDT